MSRNSYVRGAGILAIGGLLSRFIGLFYKAAVTKILGSYAMGLYYNAFFVLTFVLSFMISAVPITLSKMIAEKRALGETKNINKIMLVVTVLLSITGAFFTYLIVFYGKAFIAFAGWDPNTYYPLIGLSFAPLFIVFVCIIRGYFQGMNKMEPTAKSQIAESFARLLVGVPLCYYMTNTYHTSLGAGGATFAISASEAVGLVVLFAAYTKYRKQKNLTLTSSQSVDSAKTILKSFLSIAVPVSITSLLLSLNGMVNSITYASRLPLAGIALEDATKMFGDYSNASTLINIPMTISMAVSTAILPAIAESYVKKDMASICRKTESAMRIIFMVGFPCIVGLSLFSDQIFSLIFNDSIYGGHILSYSSFSIVFIMMAATLQTILQAINVFKQVMKDIIIGTIIKFVLNYILMAIPEINIYGMIISNFVSFGVIALLNYRILKKTVGYKINIWQTIMKPLLASLIMALFLSVLGKVVFAYFSNSIAIILMVSLAIPFYTIALFLTNTIKEEDLDMIPKGEKLKKYYTKR